MIIAIFILHDTTSAIPAFARQYRMSCQTCHSPFPKLKPYGDDFAGNGFVLSDQEAPRYFLETGDPELSLIRDFPLAIRLDAHVTYRSDNTNSKTDLSTPYLLKLLSGGSLAKDMAYYFYFYMNERGEVAGVEDAFIMFNNLFGQDLDVYIGQFQISDPLFKRELRLTLEDYHIYKTKVGFSKANLTYDRGIMITYGLETGTDIIFEIVNGNGLSTDALDNDKYKNFFGRISQDIGDYFRLGAFGYLGKEEFDQSINSASASIQITGLNNFKMYGPDLTINIDDIVELNAQYLLREDEFDYSSGVFTDGKVKTNGGMAELVITPEKDESRLYGALLYNFIDSDNNAYDYRSAAVHGGYLLKRNFRLVAEYRRDLENEMNLLSFGFVAGF
ncbi:MAG: hypothetical protein K9J16_09095 [Melioribacteraceae bacterium]|nr:hypothetical protein [Melioribacteraceae bacterium]MCF8353238.1 hypothetical protein [Melioribacteraceae bacterium]MCF8393970.1 hypothetical protein [Melioribacteraceae bacterium]MCF8418728.1 hypothetical protein [Melioribacteraceae bacterium]